MTIYIRESGEVRECKGKFALLASEELVKRFPKRYRFTYRDNQLTIVEKI